jgi:ribosomal-protein-alanine N-acetyltransferase
MTMCHVRYMIRRDFPEAVAIESASFMRPLSQDEMLARLRRRNCIGMVAEHGERVVGFMIYGLYKDRLELIDLAVDPGSRRMAVGRQMVAKLADKLRYHRRPRIALEVNETNLAAQLFFRAQGFRATGVLRGADPETGDDSYRMQYAPPRPWPATLPAWATEDDGSREC